MNPDMGWRWPPTRPASTPDVPGSSAEGETGDATQSRADAILDVFGAREIARLRFLRWLYQTRRIEP